MADQRTPPAKPGAAATGVATESVRAVVAPVVAAAGADLEDLQLRRAGSRLLLRVLIDTEQGVTLDEAAAVATSVSAALDDAGVLGERAYVLDVGSPGVDRPLTLTRHWRRNIGRLVRITGVDGSVAQGRITAVADGADDRPPAWCTVEVGGTPRRVEAAAVRRAVVQIEFADGQSED